MPQLESGFSGVKLLGDLTVEGARGFGERIAIEQHDRELSFNELNRLAEGFAGWLADQGIGAGDFVLIVLENSFEYAIGLMAIARLGAVAAPLNPEGGAEPIRKSAANCAARAMIVRERTIKRFELDGLTPIIAALSPDFDANCAAFFSQPFEAVPRIDPASPAMVLYTSGTTSQPKGVVLSHRALLANARSIVSYLALTGTDSILNVLPFFFSFGNSILTTHLLVGARIMIENRFLFPSKVVEELQRKRPTGFSGVPSTYYILLEKTAFLKKDWGFLRYISQAGGGMRAETVRRLRAAMPNTKIFITYGQTEASARLSWLDPAMLDAKIGSVGCAIPSVELRVVGEDGRELPPGEIGQIIARGDNIMNGYLGDAAATTEVLRDGWLWTGDMARTDEDGFIYIVSRKKDFIKSASYRISPGEIEEVVGEIAGVVDVAAIGIEDALLGETIAVCVTCPIEMFNPEAIRNRCMERLASYKVPKYIVHEPAIPRTASGKTKYQDLRDKYAGIASAQ